MMASSLTYSSPYLPTYLPTDRPQLFLHRPTSSSSSSSAAVSVPSSSSSFAAAATNDYDADDDDDDAAVGSGNNMDLPAHSKLLQAMVTPEAAPFIKRVPPQVGR